MDPNLLRSSSKINPGKPARLFASNDFARLEVTKHVWNKLCSKGGFFQAFMDWRAFQIGTRVDRSRMQLSQENWRGACSKHWTMQYMVYSWFSWCWASSWTKGSSAPRRGNAILSKNYLRSPNFKLCENAWMKNQFFRHRDCDMNRCCITVYSHRTYSYEEKHHLNIENDQVGQHGQRKKCVWTHASFERRSYF